MTKIPRQRMTRASTDKGNLKSDFREVTADDVIKQLLVLFDELGIDAEGVAGRVGYLRNSNLVPQRLYPYAAAIGELLTSWHQDPNYLDDEGNPAQLKMRAGKRSFQVLARSFVPHMQPKSLLSELRRVGAVICKNRWTYPSRNSIRSGL